MLSVFDSHEFNANLFFPRRDSTVCPRGAEDFWIEVAPSVRIHARKFINTGARFSLLYFHGNGEIVSDYNDISALFLEQGVELIVCDYRGYGKSEGTPTLRTVMEDAHSWYEWLRQQGKLMDSLCVMGRSLGSAPAIELCRSHREIKGCVIESGYADPIPLVERRGLKIASTTEQEDALFNNSRKIRDVVCPLLIMHGEDDFLISPQEADLNYRNAGSQIKHLEIFEGVGHNDMMMSREYFVSLNRFFSQQMGL